MDDGHRNQFCLLLKCFTQCATEKHIRPMFEEAVKLPDSKIWYWCCVWTFLSSRNTRNTRRTKTQFVREKDVWERQPWTWKSYILSNSNKWSVQYCWSSWRWVKCLSFVDKIYNPALYKSHLRFEHFWWKFEDFNIFGGNLNICTFLVVKLGEPHWFHWVGYQLPVVVNLCLSDKSTRGWTVFYGQATEWYWLNEWHWLNNSVVHFCRYSSGMSAAFKHDCQNKCFTYQWGYL